MGLSPMMKHYLKVKEQYKDCIVFYRLGDFYEMFFDDAVKVSGMLDLTLTGRDCGLEERAPMCGVPFHAADLYISKLVAMGEKVAVCEQLNEPVGKELVERDVIKVVTAGTVTNAELIDEKSNNFLGSVYISDKNVAFAWADITTGEFFVKSFDGENAYSELSDTLVRVSPVEIIANDEAVVAFKDSPFVRHGVLPKFNTHIESVFDFNNATEELKKQFNVASLSSFGIDGDKACVPPAGALLGYLNQTQKHSLKIINSIKVENDKDLMMLDVNAIRNLELTKTLRDGKRYGSLLWLLDKTKTSMGARKLQNWILSPLNNKDEIDYRLDGVDGLFKNTLVRQSVSDLLSSVKDVARISGKISNGNLMPKDCIALRNSLEVLPNIKFSLLGVQSKFIGDIVEKMHDFSDTVKLLADGISEDAPNTLKDGGYIKSGFNPELDELRNVSKNSKRLIVEIENREREKTGIRNLKISYNRVFGYYIEVTNSYKNLVPYDYVRKQTLVNAERFVTEELKELEEKIISGEEKSLRLEADLYNQIKSNLLDKLDLLKETSEAISDLDVLVSLANVARENGYVKPDIVDDEKALNISDGRHPVVEAVSKQRFVPNDCVLDNSSNRTMILTGPNMAGKSTYMRQTALIVLMAHIGSFVPASSAEIPIVDKIFTRIGASDNLILDQSTFMVEMTETAKIIMNATSKSLLILDEIGRGTSTYDGLSIAWAVVEYINDKIKAKTMFATHYHELTELESILEGVKNYKVAVKEMQGGIVFLRKIMRGGTNKSFGIEVAELAGVSKTVTERAKQILKRLEENDITKKDAANIDDSVENGGALSEVERIIKDIDVNNISPMQAFSILTDLHEKVSKD